MLVLGEFGNHGSGSLWCFGYCLLGESGEV